MTDEEREETIRKSVVFFVMRSCKRNPKAWKLLLQAFGTPSACIDALLFELRHNLKKKFKEIESEPHLFYYVRISAYSLFWKIVSALENTNHYVGEGQTYKDGSPRIQFRHSLNAVSIDTDRTESGCSLADILADNPRVRQFECQDFVKIMRDVYEVIETESERRLSQPWMKDRKGDMTLAKAFQGLIDCNFAAYDCSRKFGGSQSRWDQWKTDIVKVLADKLREKYPEYISGDVRKPTKFR